MQNRNRQHGSRSSNNQVGNPREMQSPFDMFEAMASKMMKDFGNFGPMMNRDFPNGSMMERLERDDPFESFGGVFGRDFMNMDSMFNKMLENRKQDRGNGREVSNLPGGGMVQAQTYCFSSSMGEDGQPVTKKYFAHKSRGLGMDGENIGEMQEMYHDSGK